MENKTNLKKNHSHREIINSSGPRKQLSLSSRKNVKQFQPNFNDHAIKIQDVLKLNGAVNSKIDWVPLADKCDEGGHKNGCGEIFYDKVMGGLATNFARLAGTSGREELLEQWTTLNVGLRFDEKQEQEWTTTFVEGDLELVSRGEPWKNPEHAGLDLVSRFVPEQSAASVTAHAEEEDELDPETNLPRSATKSLQDCDGAITEAQTRQRVAVGLDFDIVMDVDFPRLQELLPKGQLLGAVWQAINEKLAEALEEAVAQGRDVVETLLAKWPNAMVKFAFDDATDAHMIDFSEGDMIVLMQSSLVADVSSLGADLIESISR
jgi:hypothetical protein